MIASFLTYAVATTMTFLLRAKDIISGSLPLLLAIALLIATIIPVILIGISLSGARKRFLEREEMVLQSANDQEMKDWLTAKLAADNLGVSSLICFGSVIHNYQTRNDVDVIIVMSDTYKANIRQRFKRIQRIRKEFQDVFGHSLHCQWFLESEATRLQRFLVKAGSYESLFGKIV